MESDVLEEVRVDVDGEGKEEGGVDCDAPALANRVRL